MMATPTDAELIQAQVDLWRHSLCYLTPMALRCAVQLGIPTAIHGLGGKTALNELATALSLPPAKVPFLDRLLRLLVATGVLKYSHVEWTGTYYLNPLSYILVDGVAIDGDARQSALLLACTSPRFLDAALGLADWFRKDAPAAIPSPFEDVHGAALFEESMALLDPEADEVFNEALAAHDHMGVGVVLRECGGVFKGLKSLTDVRGGDGTTARAVVQAYPHIKCTVLDLPKVIEKAPADGVVNYVAGDLFHVVPPSQAVLLKLVLHHYGDEESVKILSQCKKAIPSRAAGGKVIAIDIVIDYSSDKMLEAQLIMDVAMMVLTRGRQRDENDWRDLFLKAGFSDYKLVKKLGARGVFEVYP